MALKTGLERRERDISVMMVRNFLCSDQFAHYHRWIVPLVDIDFIASRQRRPN
jgi:hypothetical protein